MPYLARYRLDEMHGFGGFATVWRGWDPELEIVVAVKILAENWAGHADVRERFLEEARLLRRIADPRVIRVHDVGTYEGRPYFVMDFIDGGTLADRIGPDLSTDDAVRFAVEAARGVQVLHDAGVLHRDIKPGNLLVRGDDASVLVSDLGSAKQIANASGFTVTTGTPAYMAPEQARGRSLDARTDVYSLGVLTYELMTGTTPFDGGETASVLSRTAADRPAPLTRMTALTGSVDRSAADRVLARALAFDPDDRPATPADLADALDLLLAGRKVQGFGRIRREVPVVAVVLASVACLAGTFAAIVLWP